MRKGNREPARIRLAGGTVRRCYAPLAVFVREYFRSAVVAELADATAVRATGARSSGLFFRHGGLSSFRLTFAIPLLRS